MKESKVEAKGFTIGGKDRFLEQFSTQRIQDLDDSEVGTSADHALKSLRSDPVIDLSHLFDLPHLIVVGTLDMGSPGAVNVLSPLKSVQIHTFYQLSSLSFELLEKGN